MLDTDSCIFLMNRSRPKLVENLYAHSATDIVISIVTAAELQFGVEKSERKVENQKRLDILREEFVTRAFDEFALGAYATLRAELERKGKPIGPLDMLIAGHAIAIDATLITSNLREFRRVKELRCESWAS